MSATRRIIRTQRLIKDLGHADVTEALLQALEMRDALRIISTWASVDGCLNAKHVQELCDKALKVQQ